MHRYSLDIGKGWPIARLDEKGPLCFYSDALAAQAADKERIHELESNLAWFIGYAQSLDHGCSELPNSRHCPVCQQIGIASRALGSGGDE